MTRTMLGLSLLATPMLAAYTSIITELEDYSFRPKFAPFVVKDYPSASGGKVIELPDGATVLTDTAIITDREVEVVFTTTETAVVNVRVHGLFADISRDSFFYSLDGGSFRTQNNVAPNVWDVYGTYYAYTTPGDHKLVILARETEALLDKVEINVIHGEIFLAAPALVVELESLSSQSSFSPFVVESGANATGGEYIVLPSSASAQLDPAQGTDGQMEIAFTLTETTDVNLEARVSFPADSSASFFYKLDGESFQTLSSVQTGDDWVSLSVRNYTAVLAGGHTLVIRARETGAKLDSIRLVTWTGGIAVVRDETPQPPTAQPIVPEEPVLPPQVVEEHASQHGMSPICVLGLTVLCIGAVLF